MSEKHVKRMEKQFTPNIIWYWSILCFLKMRSCHWEVKLSHTRYIATKNSPIAWDGRMWEIAMGDMMGDSFDRKRPQE